MGDIDKANSSNEIKNGTMVVSCGRTGFPRSGTIVYNNYAQTIPTLNSIKNKYNERFDDPSYYYGHPRILSEYTVNIITSLIANKDNHSRYFDGVQANGLYGLDLFLNFYQNNINSGNDDDINATANYVRNPNCWAYNVDLTCCSPWNMHPTLRLSGVLTGSSNHRPVTLISPRHILGVKHADFYPPSGSDVRFITENNETITRRITNLIVIPNQNGGVQGTTLYTVDFIVGLLDSAVPDSITFAKILPDDYQNKLQKHNALIAFKNQDQSAIIQKYNGYGGLRRIGTTWDQSPVPLEDYSEAIDSFSVKPSGIDQFSSFRLYDSGSPIFLIINNEPILLGLVNTTGGGAAYPITDYILAVTTEQYNINGTTTSSYKNLINSAMTSLGGGYQLTQANLGQFKNITDDPIPPPPAEWQTLYAYNFLNLNGTNNLYTSYPTVDGPLVFTFELFAYNNTYYYWRDTTTVLYDINGIIAPGNYLSDIYLIFDYIEGIWKITTSDIIQNNSSDFIYSTFDPFNGPWNVINSLGGSYVDGYAAGAVINDSYITLPT